MLTTPLRYKVGAIKTITKIMAMGTPNSKVNHFMPPPSRKPTNAGADTKLMTDNCVAITDIQSANQPNCRPPRK